MEMNEKVLFILAIVLLLLGTGLSIVLNLGVIIKSDNLAQDLNILKTNDSQFAQYILANSNAMIYLQKCSIVSNDGNFRVLISCPNQSQQVK